jgi:hypothetical protein
MNSWHTVHPPALAIYKLIISTGHAPAGVSVHSIERFLKTHVVLEERAGDGTGHELEVIHPPSVVEINRGEYLGGLAFRHAPLNQTRFELMSLDGACGVTYGKQSDVW